MVKYIAFTDLQPGASHITVQELGSGWAAVQVWINNEIPDVGPFPEPYNTGFCRYATREEAVLEAFQWAQSDELPLDAKLEKEVEGLRL